MLKAIDLCAGAGGWACAARGLPIEIVAAVDSWDVCCKTYKLNFPEVDVIFGDVRDRDLRRQLVRNYGRHVDVVLGAIPCEWLSKMRAANGQGVSDDERQAERKTLPDVLDLVKRMAPRFWCLEDVKGLAAELPPGVPWFEIDAAHYSAQRRKRIYVGEYPIPFLRQCGSGKVLASHLRPGPYRIGRRAADRTIATSRTFSANKIGGAYPNKKSPTVCAWSSRRDDMIVVVDPDVAGGRRQMEWQEAARLQGFPGYFVFYGPPCDVWKMVGQAIQIDTGRAILQEMCQQERKKSHA